MTKLWLYYLAEGRFRPLGATEMTKFVKCPRCRGNIEKGKLCSTCGNSGLVPESLALELSLDRDHVIGHKVGQAK